MNSRFREFLKTLNAEQRDAVVAPSGPILVLAGAGSGKTRVLTGRVFYLVAEQREHPDSLLVMTFTNKAARELQERLRGYWGESSRLPWAGTFHSFCARLLRQYGGEIGLAPGFTIYDTDDNEAILTGLLSERQLARDELSAGTLRGWISLIKNGGRLSGKHPAHRYVDDLLTAYNDRLRTAQAVDFDDLLRLPLDLFAACPQVLQRLRDRYRHVLIDEFQDTNSHQFEFSRILAEPRNDLFVVGDDDQAIYGWRGADSKHILEFQERFAGTQVHRLEQNYRSTQAILDIANDVIGGNRKRTDKRLWTAQKGGEKVVLRTLSRAVDEANEVVGEIVHQRRMNGYTWRDFAILFRTNSLSRLFEEVLVAQAVPYALVGGVRFYERKEIKDLLAYLRVLVNPDDEQAWRRVLKTPPRGIGEVTVAAVEETAKQLRTGFGAVLHDEQLLKLLGKTAFAKLSPVAGRMLKLREEIRELVIADQVRTVLDSSGLVDHYNDPRDPASEERIANLHQLVEAARERQRAVSEITLTDFLAEAALVADVDAYEEQADRVTLMTLHSAKGLEFPVVFITGVEEGLLPHRRSMDSQAGLEEERRLFYVGVTRARERLYLTYSQSRTLYGGRDFQEPSRFLRDIEPTRLRGWTLPPRRQFEDSLDLGDGHAPASSRHRDVFQMSRPASPSVSASLVPYRIGDLVEHADFGLGVVTAKSGDAENLKVRVAFEGIGSKLLAVKYAQLKKVD
ncbi:UvrD-helicase domain-containing protein [candidate division KSB1 bacterium]|nr:UvrD-helicase domain-containing protein [candidate division KSB1 bacterium]